MSQETTPPLRLLIIVTPNFNLMPSVALVDPMRAANYLSGETQFRWTFASITGGAVKASNGLSVETISLAQAEAEKHDIVVVSSSWSPEAHAAPQLLVALRKWARSGLILGALDTGAFILADAGLLRDRRATVHYEHIDAMQELHDNIEVSENIYILDKDRFTCCGGVAAMDLGLEIIRTRCGSAIANAAARYVFHPVIRTDASPQNPSTIEPLGHTTPTVLRQIITEMERNLEEPISIPELCERIGLSQRHVARLFERYVGRTAVVYYRDIRLDRARGLVTQTNLQLSQVAAATGFASQAHFSQVYKERFGISPRSDRLEGRIPFEFRAWPMHQRRPRPD